MAQQWSTGAIHMFVAFNPAFGLGSTPYYLGTCETFPRDERRPEWEMVLNDVSGRKKPLDASFQGEDAVVSCVLTRWDASVMNDLEDLPGSLTSVPGSYSFNDVGAMAMLEGLTSTVWLVRTFGSALANKTAYGADIPGRRYLQCIVQAPITEEAGAQPEKKHVLFYSWPFADFVNYKFVIYDYNMVGISQNLIK